MKIRILIICLIFLFGCNTDIRREYKTQDNLEIVRNEIKNNTDDIIDKAEDIKKETSNIDKESYLIESGLSHSNAFRIRPHLDSIRESSFNIFEDGNFIIDSANRIKKTDEILKESKKDVVSMEKDIAKAIAQRDKAIEERDSQIRKMLNYLIISCVIGSGLFSVIFFLTRSRIGLVLSISCIVILSIAFFVEAYLSYIALVGAGFFVLLIGMLIYYAFQQKRNFEKERNALKEVIHTVEITKYNLPKENKEKLFGDKDNNGVMDIIQSKETMEAIKQIRDEMPSLWKYILEEGKD